MTAVALHLRPGLSIADAIALARRAEAIGVDAVHGIEGINDVFVPMAAIAAATSTIGIGTYVANAYARTPQAAAFAARSLDELSGGRFTFGVGAGNPHVNEWVFGVDSTKSMAKMRDYLDVVNAVLTGEVGDRAEIGGPIHHMQSRFVSPPTRRVPVVVAAAGPRMIELAATAGDGVGLGVLISPEYLNDDIRPRACDAASAAGRDAERVRFPMAALTSVEIDEDRARARARSAISGLFHPIPHPYYDFLLRAQGYETVADALSELAPHRRWAEAAARIPNEVIDRLTITGTPQTAAARLHAYDDIADEVICLPLGGPGIPDDTPFFDMLELA
jgi:alkanesulfonate monooxygenase SsuD/methylene tetrahydromethanopterin reductase-like flavin-dependent oxidoreductase (luciferase family)